MKKTLLIALVIVMTLSMTLCTASATSGNLKILMSEDPTSSGMLAIMTALNAWADETGNTIEPMVIPYDDQLTKFPLMARNNDLPDLILTTRLTRLYPDEFINLQDVMDVSVFEPKALEIIGQDYSSGNNYCAPRQFTITTVFYNADAFEKAELTPPEVGSPWTLEELYANAEKLQKDGGVKYGMAVDFSRARYDNLMYMNGGSMVEKDGDSFKVAINSQNNIDTLQKFIDMNNSGVLPKAIWAGGGTDNPADYFKNGDLGIYFSGSWNYNAFVNDISGFNWGIMPSPAGVAGASAILGGDGIAVPANAVNTELAISFLQWFYETPGNFGTHFLDIDKGLSSVAGVTYTPEDAKIAADFAVMQAEAGNVTDFFSIDETSAWRNYKDNEYREYLSRAVNGDLSAADALNQFAQDLSESSDWAIAE